MLETTFTCTTQSWQGAKQEQQSESVGTMHSGHWEQMPNTLHAAKLNVATHISW